MIARLIAVNVINGNYVYSEVPKALKQQVKEQLIYLGHEDLAVG